MNERTVRVTGTSVKMCSGECYSVEILREEAERALEKFNAIPLIPTKGQKFIHKCTGRKYIRPSSQIEAALSNELDIYIDFWGIDLETGDAFAGDSQVRNWKILS